MSLIRQCLVSFGANLGVRDNAIVTAIRELSHRPEVQNLRTSRLFETPAIGGPSGQSSFLNGVAVFDTQARAREVLDWLQDIETRLGRQRNQRWAARSIDLDVVLHGSLIGGATDLTVPHPRFTARRFVLRPACDIAADYLDPRCGWTIAQLAEHLDRGNPSFALAGGDESMRHKLCEILAEQHGIHVFQAAPLPVPMAIKGTAPNPIRDERNLSAQTEIKVSDGKPWVAAFIPELSSHLRHAGNPAQQAIPERNVPRLVARIQWIRRDERWPAADRIWPTNSTWPEYRLEVDDFNWAAAELVAALTSMRCPLVPLNDDQDWWR